MNKLMLELEVAYELVKENIGKTYRIYMSSLSGGTDIPINSGIIEDVDIDYTNSLMSIRLEEQDNTENFNYSTMREINTAVYEKFTLINPVYNDGSYFKIYITKEIG